jgi:hypothetical protein
MTVSRSFGVLSVFVLLLAAACGSEKKTEEGKAEKECGAAPAGMAARPTLPARFPTPDKVTYTGQKKTGPSTIVEGYRDGELGEAFDDYKAAFGSAGYDVTKDEKEEDDAEVNFAGGNSTGQVKMIQSCKDRTNLSLTIRPQ